MTGKKTIIALVSFVFVGLLLAYSQIYDGYLTTRATAIPALSQSIIGGRLNTDELSIGPHTLKLRAKTTAGSSLSQQTTFTVTQSDLAELPRQYIDTAYEPPVGGQLWSVREGDNLQDALNNSQCGDIIELEAGATFTGNFILPLKECDDWIYIKTSAYDELPAPGSRVSPDQANLMPKIVSPNVLPALKAGFGVNHYRFIGLDISSSSDQLVYNLISLGHDVRAPQSIDELVHHFTFDRCYIHGSSTSSYQRAILALARHFAIIDSYVSDIHAVGFETQAVSSDKGSGPFKIVNNFLEAAGENVMFGGGGSPINEEFIPSDIEITGNHLYKPWAWKIGHPDYAGTPWAVKNILEFKVGRRVLIEGNLLENVWVHAQHGDCIVITPRESLIEDITIKNNVIKSCTNGIALNPADVTLDRVVIDNNLIYDIDRSSFKVTAPGGDRHSNDIEITHNTVLHDDAGAHTILMGDNPPVAENILVRDNIFTHGSYGIFGSGKGVGFNSVDYYLENYDFQRNALISAITSLYGDQDNYREFLFPVDISAVGFSDTAFDDIADFKLLSDSLYKSEATDGTDLGANIDTIIEQLSSP